MAVMTQAQFQEKYGRAPSHQPLPTPVTSPEVSKSATAPSPNLGQLAAGQYTQAGQKITGAITQGANKLQAQNAQPMSSNPLQAFGQELGKTGSLLESGLGAAAGFSQGLAAPLTATLQKVFGNGGNSPSPTANLVPQNSPVHNAINSFTTNHPEAAQNLMDALSVGGTALGDVGGAVNPLNTPLSDVANTAKTLPGRISETAGQTAQNVRDFQAAQAQQGAAKANTRAIDAVDPELTGKKLTAQGYKEAALGQRDINSKGLISRQTLTPKTSTQELGTRLRDVLKTTDPVKNLKALGTNMKSTEAKIQTLLNHGAPEMVFNANKPALLSKLDEIKSTMPREFNSIKDSKSVFNDTVDFAKQLVGSGEDTIGGIRNTRMAFDQQAKLEFPSAFKEGGSIDIKNPAGRAIKAVRDTMNDHLYETAPKGSQIKNLIGRESDIYKAIDYIAPKAVKTHGLNVIQSIMKAYTDHPWISGLATLGTLGGAYTVGKSVVNAASGE